MLQRNILLRTEIQIDNAQGEAARGATIEQQASAKPEPKLISVRDSQSQALSQSFPGAKHLAKLKSVGESQPSSSVVVARRAVAIIVNFIARCSVAIDVVDVVARRNRRRRRIPWVTRCIITLVYCSI